MLYLNHPPTHQNTCDTTSRTNRLGVIFFQPPVRSTRSFTNSPPITRLNLLTMLKVDPSHLSTVTWAVFFRWSVQMWKNTGPFAWLFITFTLTTLTQKHLLQKETSWQLKNRVPKRFRCDSVGQSPASEPRIAAQLPGELPTSHQRKRLQAKPGIVLSKFSGDARFKNGHLSTHCSENYREELPEFSIFLWLVHGDSKYLHKKTGRISAFFSPGRADTARMATATSCEDLGWWSISLLEKRQVKMKS